MKLRLVFAILYVIFYMTSVIIAGHGLGTVSELFFSGSLEAWRMLKFLGYFGSLFFVIFLLTVREIDRSRFYLFVACFFIYISWFTAAISAGSFWGDVVFSAHFQVLTITWIGISIYKHRSLEAIGRIFSLANVLPVFLIACVFELIMSISYATGKSVFELIVNEETAYKLENVLAIFYNLCFVLCVMAFSLAYRKQQRTKRPVTITNDVRV